MKTLLSLLVLAGQYGNLVLGGVMVGLTTAAASGHPAPWYVMAVMAAMTFLVHGGNSDTAAKMLAARMTPKGD
jgi:hypothetical protein